MSKGISNDHTSRDVALARGALRPPATACYLSEAVRQQLIDADDHRCTYYQTTQANTGQPMVVDHLLPETQGGSTQFDNLCFACRRCNELKGATTRAPDPLTGDFTPLYHPRQHQWSDHFAWDAAGIRRLGLSPIGRSTILALNINNEVVVAARRRWVVCTKSRSVPVFLDR